MLGNPGSGCSTLLKTLANQRREYHSVHGQVHYDSFTSDDIEQHYRGDVQYCPEDDVHFPTLSVEETIRFSTGMRAPENRPANMTRQRYVEEVTDTMASTFGLQHVRKTCVGDAAIRGISGGEKKRVSLSESLSTRPVIGAWDK